MSVLLAVTLASCAATCSEPWLRLKAKETQPERFVKTALTVIFAPEWSAQLVERFRIARVDIYESADREVHEEVRTCPRQTTAWDAGGARDVTTKSTITPTGRQVAKEWVTRCRHAITGPWAAQPVKIMLQDLDVGRMVWSWEGTTDLKGRLPLSPRERVQFLSALQGVTRSGAIRGQLVLSSRGQQSETSLLQQPELRDLLELLRRN